MELVSELPATAQERQKMAGGVQSAVQPWRKVGALQPTLRSNRGAPLNMGASFFPAVSLPPPSTTQDHRQSAETRATAPCRPRRPACRLPKASAQSDRR